MEAYYQGAYASRSEAMLSMSLVLLGTILGTILSTILVAAIGFAVSCRRVVKPSPGRCSKLSASISSCLMK